MESAKITPADIFQGYNTVVGNAKNTCLTGTVSSKSGSSEVKIKVCTGYSSVAEALNIDVSASVGIAGLGSAEAKHSYFHSLAVTQQSVTVLVKATCINQIREATSVKIGDDAMAEAQKSLKTFVLKYGDSYVSTVSTGGEYIAAYVFYAETKDETTHIENSLSANGIADDVSVGSSFSEKLNRVSKSSTARTSFSQITGVSGISLPKADDVVQFALDFSKTAANASGVVAWDTTGYEELPELNALMAPVVDNREYFRGVPGIVEARLDQLAVLIANQAQAAEIKSTYQYYGGFSDPKLDQNRAAINHDIDAVRNQLRTFMRDPTQPPEHIELPALELGYPKLSLTTAQKGTTAPRTDGDFYEDQSDLVSFVRKHGKIAEFSLSGDSTINQIRTTYSIGGQEVVSEVGPAGTNRSTLDLRGTDYYPLDSYQWSEWGATLKHLTIAANGRPITMGHVEPRAVGNGKLAPGEFLLSMASRKWGNEIIQVCFNVGTFKPSEWITT